MKCPNCRSVLMQVHAGRIPIGNPQETATRPGGGPFSKEIPDVVAIACSACSKVIGIVQD
jgi:hypothetical protein